MAVSEAIYGSTSSYVSSSAYYGFIPQNNQQPAAGTSSNWCSVSSSSGCSSWNVNANTVQNMIETSNGNWLNHNHNHNQSQSQTHGGAMETDDVDIVNNYCVIPDPALRGISTPVYSNYLETRFNTLPPPGFGALDRNDDELTAARRRNRKRNNDGELVLLETDQLKRLRKGSGNGCTYHGRGFAKDGGLAKVHYKSARLCLSRWKDIDQDEELETFESCCWAAGNHSCLVDTDDTNKVKDPSLIDNFYPKTCSLVDVEYEKMLLETHGCSAYHHQRLQSQNEIAESEF